MSFIQRIAKKAYRKGVTVATAKKCVSRQNPQILPLELEADDKGMVQ